MPFKGEKNHTPAKVLCDQATEKQGKSHGWKKQDLKLGQIEWACPNMVKITLSYNY